MKVDSISGGFLRISRWECKNALLSALTNKLSEESDDSYKFWLESQKQAAGFYKKMGFIATSEEYDLWGLGILHVTMRLPCVA
jgi:predicted GNAT family N-acyltransferase